MFSLFEFEPVNPGSAKVSILPYWKTFPLLCDLLYCVGEDLGLLRIGSGKLLRENFSIINKERLNAAIIGADIATAIRLAN
jgi:hypothetical protein